MKTVDAESIAPVGKLGSELIAKLDAYKTAYWAHRNYKPKTWADEMTTQK